MVDESKIRVPYEQDMVLRRATDDFTKAEYRFHEARFELKARAEMLALVLKDRGLGNVAVPTAAGCEVVADLEMLGRAMTIPEPFLDSTSDWLDYRNPNWPQ